MRFNGIFSNDKKAIMSLSFITHLKASGNYMYHAVWLLGAL
jgi:hypothetical protein